MADTQRTQTDLLTNLFQDGQDDGSISPQDVRDLIVSFAPSHGGFYVSTAAATTISGAGTFVKASGTTTLLTTTSKNFSMPTDNRLRYDGVPTINVFAQATMGIKTASANTIDIAARLAEDGVDLAETEQRVHAATTGKLYPLTVQGLFELETSEYLEVEIANITDTDNLQIDYMNFFAIGFHI